jgi:hypothetical protein
MIVEAGSLCFGGLAAVAITGSERRKFDLRRRGLACCFGGDAGAQIGRHVEFRFDLKEKDQARPIAERQRMRRRGLGKTWQCEGYNRGGGDDAPHG